jgi:acyl-coenzyme A thioesterase PaaI-like protein
VHGHRAPYGRRDRGAPLSAREEGREPARDADALLAPDAPWRNPAPGRLVGAGHPIGDFLEAHEWRVLEERPGFLLLDCHLPERVKNFRGQLFGGFTPVYVDFVALHTFRAGRPKGSPRHGLVTMNMRTDYFEPVVTEHFRVESSVIHRRGKNGLVQTRFLDAHGSLLVFALTTLRELG